GGVVLIDALDDVLPANLTAVAGCDVVVEPWRPEERSKRSQPELWTERTKTDGTGYFETGTTAKPGHYDSTITVACPGHSVLEHVFKHDRLHHYALIIVDAHRPAPASGRTTTR